MDSIPEKKPWSAIFLDLEIPTILGLVIYSTLPLIHVANSIVKTVHLKAHAILSTSTTYHLLGLSMVLIVVFLTVAFLENNTGELKKIQYAAFKSLLMSGFLIWICDFWWFKQDTLSYFLEFIVEIKVSYAHVFSTKLIHYIKSMRIFYSILFVSLFLLSYSIHKQNKEFISDISRLLFFVGLFVIPALVVVMPLMLNELLFSELKKIHPLNFSMLDGAFMGYANLIYSIAMMLLIGFLFQKTFCVNGRVGVSDLNKKSIYNWSRLLQFIKLAEKIMMVVVLFEVVNMAIPYFMNYQLFLVEGVEGNHFFSRAIWLPFGVLFLCLTALKRYCRAKLLNEEASVGETSGQFGMAAWMSTQELKAKGCFNAETGPIFGTTEKGELISLPLFNTLTLGPPGLGKSLMYIATLLKDPGPKFVWDIKGELFLTTARYRAKTLGRRVILLDFYQILSGFTNDFPEDIRKIHRFNPFDYLPEGISERDQMLTSFVCAFIIRDTDQGGAARHFDENAKILIRGYIDFIMKMTAERKKRTLKKLYALMNEKQEEANDTYLLMQKAGGHAEAAANLILRVGVQERGSIISTANRQMDWVSDSNIQEALSESTFDLRDFLKGNMDIYVVLPSGQVHEKSRLFRILLALLKAMIMAADPSELPDSKMMILMDEIAQLGYCPDIEQFIEIMRSYKVVVWAAFQTLSQIKLYKKFDLFLSAPIKQFFTTSDIETMKWIQALGGKKTIKTKNISSGKSDTQQKMHWLTGNISVSEGESIHETGVDLIKSNDISEMPSDEQFIFWSGNKPIKCKKIVYYQHPYFKGKFNENPFESDMNKAQPGE